MSVYETLSKIDVGEFTEKKGQFTYLSWANAVDVLLQNYPEATWDVIRNEYGLPYVSAPNGAFVTVWVEIEGIKRTICHPVLDYRNKAVVDPDSFVVNTSIQRALAKCISLHGLGLYIYRGEDFPEVPQQISPEPINDERVDGCYEMLKGEIDGDNDEPDYERMQTGITRISNDERLAVFSKFGKEKPEGAKRMYATIISDCLKMKNIDGVWQK